MYKRQAIIQSLQSIVARQTNPVDSAVVSITMVNGGSAFNVIPDSVELGGTARAILPETRERTEENLRKIVNALATAHGCEAEIDWRAGYPPTINHKIEANRAAAIASDIVGAEKVHMDMPPFYGSRRFCLYVGSPQGRLYLARCRPRTRRADVA